MNCKIQVKLKNIMNKQHGFAGEAQIELGLWGTSVGQSRWPILSLYGKSKKKIRDSSLQLALYA
jgi:hypothetical protein